MKVFKYICFTFIVIAFIANLPIINTQILHYMDGQNIRYSNANASYTAHETFSFKGPSISEWAIQRFIRETNPKPENRTVYRLYRINPLCFWRWSYYISTSSDYPYKDWEEIKANRVPYREGNMWQDF